MIKNYLFILISLICLESCNGQNFSTYEKLMEIVIDDCQYLQDVLLDNQESCSIYISEELIPLEMSLFIFDDNIKYFPELSKIESRYLFDSLLIYESKDVKLIGDNFGFKNLNEVGIKFNLKLYFSECKNGYITCEVMPYKKDHELKYNNGVLFGLSIYYLFKLNKKGEVETWTKIEVNNN